MPVLSKVVLGSIDEEFRPLIDELNRVGLKTLASCSGHGEGAGYIAIELGSLLEVYINDRSLTLYLRSKRVRREE